MAIPNSVAAVPDDCSRAQIIISPLLLHAICRGPELILDGADLNGTGAVAVKFAANGFVMDTVAAERGNRPWSHSVGALRTKP